MGYGRAKINGVWYGGYPPHPLSGASDRGQKKWFQWTTSWGQTPRIATFTVPWYAIDAGSNDVQYWAIHAISKRTGTNEGDIRLLEWGNA